MTGRPGSWWVRAKERGPSPSHRSGAELAGVVHLAAVGAQILVLMPFAAFFGSDQDW